MSERKTEADRLQHVVASMPASQALSYLAYLVMQGGPRERGEAIAALLMRFSATLDAEMALVRDGVQVNSHEDEVRSVREYAVRTVQPDGSATFATYGDRLFAAVNDARRLGEAEVLCRDVVVGPWRTDVVLHGEGDVQRG